MCVCVCVCVEKDVKLLLFFLFFFYYKELGHKRKRNHDKTLKDRGGVLAV